MIFVTATDTNIGKTYFSHKIIQHMLDSGMALSELAYYKPVQCGKEFNGEIYETDYQHIARMHPGIKTYCSYDLEYPASPNFAAALEKVSIDLAKIKQDLNDIKSKHSFVVVEGAGGLMVPLNDQDLVSDIARVLDLPLVLVIRPDLGTINHSLLSIEHARAQGLEIRGLIVSRSTPSSARYSVEDDELKARQVEDSIRSILDFGKVEIFDITKLECLQTTQ